MSPSTVSAKVIDTQEETIPGPPRGGPAPRCGSRRRVTGGGRSRWSRRVRRLRRRRRRWPAAGRARRRRGERADRRGPADAVRTRAVVGATGRRPGDVRRARGPRRADPDRRATSTSSRSPSRPRRSCRGSSGATSRPSSSSPRRRSSASRRRSSAARSGCEMMRTSEQVAQYVALKAVGYDVTIVPGDVADQRDGVPRGQRRRHRVPRVEPRPTSFSIPAIGCSRSMARR